MSIFSYYIIIGILTFFLTPLICYCIDKYNGLTYNKQMAKETIYIIPFIWPIWIGFIIIYVFLDVFPIKIVNIYKKFINLIVDYPERLFEEKKND